ncbi:hypothetical protein BDV93DRAFT_528956 [Ceratobasidium sp. AG-I]|nr:hypothetical protein BDV93DRAFT_528956 [Ceratobasidium sp. AG-I]
MVGPPIIIALCGATGTGKSTFISDASGQDFPIGHMQESCTVDVRPTAPFKVDGRLVVLIDTPGFDDTTLSDADVLEKIATFLKFTYAADQKLSGVIYMHRITDNRVGGVSRRNFHTFRELCGETSLVNVVITTNMWHEPPEPIELKREDELMTSDNFFRPALAKGARCARYVRDIDDQNRAHDVIRMFMSNTPMALQVQREMVDEKKQLHETAAGKEVNGELQKLIEKHQLELQKVKIQMEEAMRRKDEETRQELDAYRQEADEKIARVTEQMQRLKRLYGARQGGREDQVKKLLADNERRRLQDEAQIATLSSRLDRIHQILAVAEESSSRELKKEAKELERKISDKKASFWARLAKMF